LKQVLYTTIADFRASWKTLAMTDIAYKFIAFVILFSVVGIIFRMMLSFTGRTVLADEDILYFLLQPAGWACLIIVGALSLGIVALEQAALMGVLQAKSQGRQMNYVGALQFAMKNTQAVLLLTARLMAVLIIVIAPFLLLAGIIYFALLTQYDINYYLTARPPEFLVAVALGLILLCALVFLILSLMSGWFFSLPLVLFENIKPSKALSISHERTKGNRFKLLRWITCWSFTMLLLSVALSWLVIWMGRLMAPQALDSLPLLAIMVGMILTFWLVTNLTVNLLGTTSFAVMLFNLYRCYGYHEELNRLQLGNVQSTLNQSGFRLTKKRLLLGAFLGIVLSSIIGLGAMYGVQFEERAEIVAHRGASAVAPENTLAAVKQAIIDQADWVEIDVQETADGEVVVFHDSDFMKLANIDLKIWDATMGDLTQIDIGSHFAARFKAERVPTLRQVLAACKGKIRVIIELKYYGHDQQLEQRVAEIVEAGAMQAEIMLMSLKSDKVKKMKALRPEWQVGLLTSAAIGNLSSADADFLAVNQGLAKRQFVRSVHNKGKQVFVWTVNDATTMSRLIGRGVDGLITDQPALARTVLTNRAELPSMGRLLLDLSEILGISPEADMKTKNIQ